MPAAKKGTTSNTKKTAGRKPASSKKGSAKRRPSNKKTAAKNTNVRDTVAAILLIGIAVCLIICFLAPTAPLCTYVNTVLYGLLGAGAIAVPVVLIYLGAMLIARHRRISLKVMLCVIFVLFLSVFINVCTFDIPQTQTVLDLSLIHI